MVRDLVAHDLHDVVAVGDEANDDADRHDGDLPQRHFGFGGDRLARLPGAVHASPHTDRVSDVVGPVGKGSRAGGDDLHERVQVFDFVSVFGSLWSG